MNYLIPDTLETQRLILRMFRESDWTSLHKYYSNENCTKFTYGRVFNESESWRMLNALAGHWIIRGYGSYALESKSNNEVIGFAGLDFPIDWPEPEIQWGLIHEHWGKGYASEAVREIKKITSQCIPDLSLISLIHPENHNSINLAIAVGAVYEKDYELRGTMCHIYRHL